MVGHSTKRKILSAPGHEVLRQPVLGVQFLFEASDLATEETAKAKRQKTALVKMKLKEVSEDLQQIELYFLTNSLSSTMK